MIVVGAAGGISFLARLLLGPLADDDASRLVTGIVKGGLKAGERELLLATAEGNPLFLEQLVVSLRTVNAHLRSVYRKLNVHSRSAATRYAVEHGLTGNPA